MVLFSTLWLNAAELAELDRLIMDSLRLLVLFKSIFMITLLDDVEGFVGVSSLAFSVCWSRTRDE